MKIAVRFLKNVNCSGCRDGNPIHIVLLSFAINTCSSSFFFSSSTSSKRIRHRLLCKIRNWVSVSKSAFAGQKRMRKANLCSLFFYIAQCISYMDLHGPLLLYMEVLMYCHCHCHSTQCQSVLISNYWLSHQAKCPILRVRSRPVRIPILPPLPLYPRSGAMR